LSAVDCFQIKNFADERFIEKSGAVGREMMRRIHATIVKCLNPDYDLI